MEVKLAIADQVNSRYYFFGDKTGVGTPEIQEAPWTYTEGYSNSIVAAEETSGGADETAKYLKLTAQELAGEVSGGWAPKAGELPTQPATIDFSQYKALVFWAKKPETPSAGKTAGSSVSFTLIDTSDDNGTQVTKPDLGGSLSSTWTKYEIPLEQFAGENISIIKALKYVLPSSDAEIYLDEIYLSTEITPPTEDTVNTRYYLLGDKTGVGTPEIQEAPWTYTDGYNNSIAAVEETGGGADETAKYLKLTAQELAGEVSGGWAPKEGASPTQPATIDFSQYEAIIYYVKSPPTPTPGKTAGTSISISIEDSLGGSQTIPTPPNAINSQSWSRFEISLTAFNVDVAKIKSIKYLLSSNKIEIYIDEIYLKKK